jgi:hypothetical protein
MGEKLVSIAATPTVMEWITDKQQLRDVVESLIPDAEKSPEWRVGKAFKIGATVAERRLELALNYTPDGYEAVVALEGELALDPPKDT